MGIAGNTHVGGENRRNRLFTRPTIGAALGLLVLVQGIALGTKAVSDRQDDNAAILQTVKSQTVSVAEAVHRRALNAKADLTLATGAPGETLNGKADMVIAFEEAQAAAPGGRLRHAADTAAHAQSNGDWFGLSDSNDIIITARNTSGDLMLALSAGASWITADRPNDAISLSMRDGQQAITLGVVDASFPAIDAGRTDAQLKDFSNGTRVAKACAGISGSDLLTCTTSERPLVTVKEALYWAGYLLLLIAPALALWGLFNHFTAARGGMRTARSSEQATRRLLETAMASANAGFWHWDTSTNTGELDARMWRLLGLRRTKTFDFETYIAAVHHEDRDRIRQLIKAIGPTEKFVLVHRVANSAPVRWVEITGRAEPATDGNAPTAFSGIGVDVSVRKRNDDRIAAYQRYLRRSIESFAGPFAIWDTHHRLLYWNDLFEETFELTGTLRRGISHDTVMISAHAQIKQERAIPKDPSARLVELKSGRWLKLKDRISADGSHITIGSDETQAVLLAAQVKKLRLGMERVSQGSDADRAALKRLEDELEVLQAAAKDAEESKSAFLQSISHELRTPLNAINGFSEMLADDMAKALPEDTRRQYAQNINEAGSKLLDIVNDLLDISRVASGRNTIMLSPIDPTDPVDAALRGCDRQIAAKNIRLSFEPAADLPSIDADHNAVRRMVSSLLSNAVKFTPEDGEICVSVTEELDQVRISVRDTGEGMVPGDLPKVVEPFEKGSISETRYVEGLGLGLSIVKATAEMHGGTLDLESAQGQGTIASIWIPVSQHEQLAASA